MSTENPEKVSTETEEPQIKEQNISDIKKNLQEIKTGKLFVLPSGVTFRLTKPSISKLLKDNVFPSELVSTALKLDTNTNIPTDREEYLKSLKVIEEIILRAIVYPKVVRTQEEVTEDSIALDDIDDTDRIAIYMYAQMGVKPLDSFRSK